MIYDKLMREFIKQEFGVNIPCLKDTLDNICWNCGEEKTDLKKCKTCLVAQYCARECQSSNWKNGHKLAHKIDEITSL